MSGTTTAGTFTISGFDASSFDSTSTTPTGTFFGIELLGGPNNSDYVFNAPGLQTIAAAGASNHWSLNVTFTILGGGNNPGFDFLQVGDGSTGQFVAGDGSGDLDGGIAGNTLSFSGDGAQALQDLFRNLSIVDGGAFDQMSVSFDLVDGPGTPTGSDSSTEDVFTQFFQAACYATGTRIAVPTGETEIEALRSGDLVVTASGVAKPIKWIGRRSYTAAQIATHKHFRPVLIRQGALAENMPHRDLMVSPMHSLFIDDVFIPAASLINDVTVLRSEALEPVSYIHIEMDAHDVVFAEGAPAETFVDDNSRILFDNADEYYDMFGADAAAGGFSAPRVEHGYQLEAIRRRLAARAGLPVIAGTTGALKGHVERLENGVLEGWVMDVTANTAPVELDVLVDGEMVARVLANRYRTDLDHAGLAGGRCAFSVTLPASAVALSQIEVRRTVDGAAIPMPAVAALTA